jgi:hypothetical protein
MLRTDHEHPTGRNTRVSRDDLFEDVPAKRERGRTMTQNGRDSCDARDCPCKGGGRVPRSGPRKAMRPMRFAELASFSGRFAEGHGPCGAIGL